MTCKALLRIVQRILKNERGYFVSCNVRLFYSTSQQEFTPESKFRTTPAVAERNLKTVEDNPAKERRRK